jgi:hypothetical protein
MRWGKRRANGGSTVSVGRGPLGAAKEVGGLVKDAIKDDIQKVSSIGKRLQGKPINESQDSSVARALKKKNVRELSNKDIQQVITRLSLEKQFNQLNPKQISFGNKIIGNLIKKYGTDILMSFLKKNAERTPPEYSYDTSNAQEGQVIETKLLKDKN